MTVKASKSNLWKHPHSPVHNLSMSVFHSFLQYLSLAHSLMTHLLFPRNEELKWRLVYTQLKQWYIVCNVRESQVQALSIQPKIPKVSVGTSNGTDHFSLLCLEYSGPALKVVHFDWSGHFGRSVGPKCPFAFDKTVVPSTALLYPAYKNNNQTQSNAVPDYYLTNVIFTERCIFRELFIGNFLKDFLVSKSLCW